MKTETLKALGHIHGLLDCYDDMLAKEVVELGNSRELDVQAKALAVNAMKVGEAFSLVVGACQAVENK